MPQKRKASGERKVKLRAYYGSRPWRCEPLKGACKIVAYVDASARWETVAVVQRTSQVRAKALGDFLVGLVNERHQDGDVLRTAFAALDGVLREGLNFSTEQEVESVVDTLKARGF